MIAVSLTDKATAWRFRDASTTRWRTAVVPGCVHRDLLRHGAIPDPFHGTNEHAVQWVSERVWEYRTEFEISAEMLAEERIDLVADGLDTLATVRVNGRVVSRSDNMFVGVRASVRDAVKPGKNVLTVQFESATRAIERERLEHRPREVNDPVGGCTRIRKQQCQFGWDWAPRLVTAGIWRELRIEAWSGARLSDVRVRQTHGAREVVLAVEPEIEFASKGTKRDGDVWIKGGVFFGGQLVGRIEKGVARIESPQLWWPNGQGEQPLYEVRVELWRGEERLDTWARRIGLRTIEVRRESDAWGESFQFVVNGRAIFAKGASWIPAHSFVAGLTRADYEPLLQSAAAANMNMIRVWGGGIYEHECFYDLCDELGLLVWQDFMFACTLYPGDAAFLRSVKAEAEYQVRRLRNRTCLALWCGNNELELLNGPDLAKPRQRKAYDAVFRRILPEAVAAFDGVTTYWRSSPSQTDRPGLRDPERSGNTHFWDVWHLLRPVKSYEEKVFRFVSEFGMQSFPSSATARTFCPPEELNIFSPVMENHQKNPMGNRIILEYIARRYRFPQDYASLAYLSQLNQAYCMQVGVEHYRRNQPRCAGTLYWQLNDCWPVASWSSLEFGGAWKALHHAARRFYAPLLMSAQVPGDETIGIGNRMKSSVRIVNLFTVSDAPEVVRAVLRWELWQLDGKVLERGEKRVVLRPGESVRQKTLDLGKPIERWGREKIYLRIALEAGQREVSEETVLLCPPRMLTLDRRPAEVACERVSPTGWELRFLAPCYQHRVAFELAGLPLVEASDNWFDLHPRRAKRVRVELGRAVEEEELRAALRVRSLVDSYRGGE
jgi:Beta-galactosidase/beta-glucuronidase